MIGCWRVEWEEFLRVNGSKTLAMLMDELRGEWKKERPRGKVGAIS